jgi:hypothetical protein
MKIKAEVIVETDEFPDYEDLGKEKVEDFIHERLVEKVPVNRLEHYEILDKPVVADMEVIEK